MYYANEPSRQMALLSQDTYIYKGIPRHRVGKDDLSAFYLIGTCFEI